MVACSLSSFRARSAPLACPSLPSAQAYRCRSSVLNTQGGESSQRRDCCDKGKRGRSKKAPDARADPCRSKRAAKLCRREPVSSSSLGKTGNTYRSEVEENKEYLTPINRAPGCVDNGRSRLGKGVRAVVHILGEHRTPLHVMSEFCFCKSLYQTIIIYASSSSSSGIGLPVTCRRSESASIERGGQHRLTFCFPPACTMWSSD